MELKPLPVSTSTFRKIIQGGYLYVDKTKGWIDAVLETDAAVYIFEFKLDGSAAEALAQIKDKEYFARYRLTGKTLHLVGVNFEMETRGVMNGKW